MDRRLVRQVLRHLDRGDRVLFGFDHFGAVRIKVKHGPFNLFSTHHRTDQETFNAIQHELALVGHEDTGKNKIVYTEAPEPPLTAAKPERTRRPSRRRKARPFKQNGVRSEPPPPDPGEPEQIGAAPEHAAGEATIAVRNGTWSEPVPADLSEPKLNGLAPEHGAREAAIALRNGVRSAPALPDQGEPQLNGVRAANGAREAAIALRNGVRSAPAMPQVGEPKLNGMAREESAREPAIAWNNGAPVLNGEAAAAPDYGRLKLNGTTAASGHREDETAPEAPRPVGDCPNLAAHLAQDNGGASEQWTKYSKTYRRKREETERLREDTKLLKRIEADEIESHRFCLENVDGSWDDLQSGDIPHIASEVWRRMERTRSVHRLAEELNIPLRECVFWLCVFKRHMGVWVELDDGRYNFVRPEGEPDLANAIQAQPKGPSEAASA